MADLFDPGTGKSEGEEAQASAPKSPTLHFDTAIYRAVIDLARHVAKSVEHMRRDMKPMLGKTLLEETVWMGVVVRRANIAIGPAKLPHLHELLEQLEIVQMGLRLARDCRYIANNAFTEAVPLVASIGRQATALRNHFAPAA